MILFLLIIFSILCFLSFIYIIKILKDMYKIYLVFKEDFRWEGSEKLLFWIQLYIFIISLTFLIYYFFNKGSLF